MVQSSLTPEPTPLARASLLSPIGLRAPVALQPARCSELLAHLSGAFDMAEGQGVGHAARVAHLAVAFADEMGLDAAAVRRTLHAGLLHDAGVAIRDLPAEVDEFGGHTAAGAWLAAAIRLDAETQQIIRSTHERWDGDGRPARLVMTEIPVEALLISAAHWVADLVAPLDNPLRARAAVRGIGTGDLEPLVGPRVAQAVRRSLDRDDIWMPFWDEGLAAELAAGAGEDETASVANVERVAEAMGAVVDSAVREHGRAERVADLAVELGRQLGLDEGQWDALRVAALLMDIGQLGVPRHVTEKPSILSIDEMEMMRRHPGAAARLLEGLPGFEQIASWVESHHERADGRGYPDLLTQVEIPLPARILAVADTYWALRAARPYREALDESEAVDVVLEATGTQFDPAVTNVLRRALRAIEARSELAA